MKVDSTNGSNGSNGSNNSNNTVVTYPAPVWSYSLDKTQTVTIRVGSAPTSSSNVLGFDINSQLSFVYTVEGCTDAVNKCSANPFPYTKSTTSYIPTIAVPVNSTGPAFEIVSGTQGAELLNLPLTVATDLVTIPFEWNFAGKRIPATPIPDSVDGVLGFSFLSQAYPNFTQALSPNSGTPSMNNGTSSVVDAVIAVNSNKTAGSSARVVSIFFNKAATAAPYGRIDIGGVTAYDPTASKINCTVSTPTTGIWSCAIGAVISTSNATAENQTTSLDLNPNAIPYFPNGTVANGTNVIFDTLNTFMVAPMATYNYFNTMFNFSGCANGTELSNANYLTVTCGTPNNLTQNNKSLWIVMGDRIGMEIPPSVLTAPMATSNTTAIFAVRFYKDTTADWRLGQDFLNGHTATFDMTAGNLTVLVQGPTFAFTNTGSSTVGNKTVYIIVGIACAVAAIAIAIVIYCCCCKKSETDDYREQK